jgi:uncharacterized protein
MEGEVQEERGLTAPAWWLLQALAALCVLLGVIGIFVPVMPTVPFLIVAAWAASRSSPRLHDWLINHPRFGRELRDWNSYGVVPRKAKLFATVMMTFSCTAMFFLAPPKLLPWVFGLVAIIVAVLAWLWKRPEAPPPGAP